MTEDLMGSVTFGGLCLVLSASLPSVSSTVLCLLASLLSSNDGPERRCGSDGGDEEPSGLILFESFMSPYSSSGRLKG